MVKKGFKDLNQVERRLMINGLKTDIALKCGKRISDGMALRILRMPTLKKQQEAISRIKKSC